MNIQFLEPAQAELTRLSNTELDVSHEIIDMIREKVRLGRYDMTAHAMEEMAEDDLDILDIEQAMADGEIERTEKGDFRGTKYTIEGTGIDRQTPIAVVGRFTDTGRYLIITVYVIDD